MDTFNQLFTSFLWILAIFALLGIYVVICFLVTYWWKFRRKKQTYEERQALKRESTLNNLSNSIEKAIRKRARRERIWRRAKVRVVQARHYEKGAFATIVVWCREDEKILKITIPMEGERGQFLVVYPLYDRLYPFTFTHKGVEEIIPFINACITERVNDEGGE